MIYVLIPTYNRPQMLANLIRDLRAENREIRLVIANDGSTKDYSAVDRLLNKHDLHIRLSGNNGKQGFYKVINTLFGAIRDKRFDYVFKLDDDLRLVDNFFGQAFEAWEAIPNKRKMAMGLMADSRTGKSSWNGIKSERYGKVWKQGWIDMIWMAKYDLLNLINFELPETYFEKKKEDGFWQEHSNRSSQVGKWLTMTMHQEGRFWNVAETLVCHGNHQSKMNPLERARNPLTT